MITLTASSFAQNAMEYVILTLRSHLMLCTISIRTVIRLVLELFAKILCKEGASYIIVSIMLKAKACMLMLKDTDMKNRGILD